MSAGTILNAIGVIGGLGGLAALVKVLVDRTKVRADAIGQIADTSVGMLAPLHGEIDRLSEKLKAAEAQIDELQSRMRTMAEYRDQMEQMKGRLQATEQASETLRRQVRGLYDDLAEKDRELIEKNRLISELRSGRE
jgi:predicted  nucleic acid-binding Zn-ribbon protein